MSHQNPTHVQPIYNPGMRSGPCEVCDYPSAATGHPKGNNAAGHFMHHPTAERPNLCEVCWIVLEQTYINRLAQKPPNGSRGKSRQQQLEAILDAAN